MLLLFVLLLLLNSYNAYTFNFFCMNEDLPINHIVIIGKRKKHHKVRMRYLDITEHHPTTNHQLYNVIKLYTDA